jgi:predicted nucleic-acid-binding Zn-ribbon protein
MQEQPKDEPNAQAQTCPKCGGRMLARGVMSYTAVYFTKSTRPGRMFPGPSSQMAAMVCDNCGYAEIYATNPEKLRD